MSQRKKTVRARFRAAVLARDGFVCRVCGAGGEQDPHHITDRNAFPNGGYVVENGIALCPRCHELAEAFHATGTAAPGFSPDELYGLIGSSYEAAAEADEQTGGDDGTAGT